MISPFENLSDVQKNHLLEFLKVHTYKYTKGQEILSTIKKENLIGIVMSRSCSNYKYWF